MFSKRERGTGILFTWLYKQGERLKDKVLEGDSVILKMENESILVNKITILDDGRFKGIIYGFEPSFSEKFNGLKIDHEIEFLEENIISCGE